MNEWRAIPMFCSANKMSFSQKHNKIFNNVRLLHVSVYVLKCLTDDGYLYPKHVADFTLLNIMLCFWLNDFLSRKKITFKIYMYITHIYRVSRGGNVPDFGRLFLKLKYTDITQNTYIRSWTVTVIMAREVWKYVSCYTLIDYQIHIKTGRNMWFL